MRLLVLGGTSFVGRHLVEAATAAGHEVSLFHRGRTGGELFPDLPRRRGDRDAGDYASLLAGPGWDAAVDVSAYVPRHVEQAAEALTGRVGHYVLVSSVSAYDPDGLVDTHEDAPLHPPLAVPTETVDGHTYGPLKAECERAALRRWGGRLAVVRPTFVAGPHDPTDRFTYWVRRCAAGGDVVVAVPEAPLQLVDARDLGAFLLRAATEELAGPYDAVGVSGTVESVVRACVPAGVKARLVPVPAETLRAAGARLPLVSIDPAAWPAMRRGAQRARRDGLAARPLADTVAATRGWDDARGRPPLTVGPTAEQEARLAQTAGIERSAPP